MWMGGGQRLQCLPEHLGCGAGTVPNARGERTSTPRDSLQEGDRGASSLCEAGSPLRKQGVVHQPLQDQTELHHSTKFRCLVKQ